MHCAGIIVVGIVIISCELYYVCVQSMLNCEPRNREEEFEAFVLFESLLIYSL